MTKLKLIREIDKLAMMGITWKRKIQLLFWDKKRLERIVKVLAQDGNRWII